MKSARSTWLLAIVLTAGLTAGCGDKVGDKCEFNVDCSTQGDRYCDLSSPGGYCTIENCTSSTCPKEAVCIAFFPVAFLTQPCDPDLEDVQNDPAGTDDCTPDGICIRSGFCAPRASEKRWCMFKCESAKDCRDAYECRRTGIDGSERTPGLNEPRSDKVEQFCAPQT